MTFFAHITGIPHHAEDAQSVLALWPLIVLAAQLIWVIMCQRTSQIVKAARQGLREAQPLFATVTLITAIYAIVYCSAQAASSPVVLRDSSARVIGSIETVSNGVQELRDSNRRLLGTYSPRTNETRNGAGRFVGNGNLLTSLLQN